MMIARAHTKKLGKTRDDRDRGKAPFFSVDRKKGHIVTESIPTR